MEVANVSVAVEIARRVDLAKASFEVNLALSKFGMAMAANKAIIATTIIISTSVKPFLFILVDINLAGMNANIKANRRLEDVFLVRKDMLKERKILV